MELVAEPTQTPVRLKPVLAIKQISWFDDRYYRVVLHDGSVRYLPSVTTYLGVLPKWAINRWRGDVGNQEADRRLYEAGEKGSRVHHACYIYSTGGGVIFNPPVHLGMKDINAQAESLMAQFAKAKTEFITISSQEEAMMVHRFRQMFSILNPDILGAEVVLYSLEMDTAGMADYILRIKEGEYNGLTGAKSVKLTAGVWLLDLKTGAQDEDHFVQLATYAKLYEESTGVEVRGVMVAYLNADTRTGIPGLSVKVKWREELAVQNEIFKSAQTVWRARNKSQVPEVFDFPTLFYRSELPNPVPNDFVLSNVKSPVKDIPENIERKTEETEPKIVESKEAVAKKKTDKPVIPMAATVDQSKKKE